MPAIVIYILLVLGGVTTVMTIPPGSTPALGSVQNTTIVTARDGPRTPMAAPTDRLRRFQQSCEGENLGKDCIAYKQLLNDMEKHNFTSKDTDLIFSQELSSTVTLQEDLCSNLTEIVKHLPPQLMHRELKPFSQVKHCVISCYEAQGEENDILKDSCRVLYVGYRTLVESWNRKTINQVSAPEQQKPNKTLPSNQQPSLPNKEQNKPSNVTLDGNRETVSKIESTKSNNVHSDAKLDSKKSEEQAVVKETNKQEIVAQPSQQSVQDKNANDDDTEQEGVNDGINNFDDDTKDPGNLSQDFKEQSDSNESAGTSSETINEVPNTKRTGDSNEKITIPEKEHVREDEVLEQIEMSRTSDIMQGSDPFYNQNDSNFFSYFLFAMFSCAMLYVAYHNKSKLMALVVEGRRTSSGRGGFSKGRKHTAAYRKLDSNLEEAITSSNASGGHSSSQIIY